MSRVSRRVPWVGEAAYPLQTIARAQRVKLVPKRGAALRNYVKAVLLWILLGAVAAIVLSSAGLLRSGANTLAGLVIIAVPVLIVVRTVRLIGVLLPPKLYALIIETAGPPRTALVSTDENRVLELVHRIMERSTTNRRSSTCRWRPFTSATRSSSSATKTWER